MNFRSFFSPIALAAIFCLLPCWVSCRDLPETAAESGVRVRIMTWNTQTFFDAVEDGTEFSEFRGTKSVWGEERYRARLERLAEGISLCGEASGMEHGQLPDFCVLQEIETERVLLDLCNTMSQRNGYSDAVFVPPGEGNAFGSAILSMHPLESIHAHATYGGETALRPLIEAEFKIGENPLVIFAVHWKSKSGSGDGNELRTAQEGLLASRIAALEGGRPGVPWIACGDFNQKSGEFTLLGEVHDAWSWWQEQCESGLRSGPPGSYYYQGVWEDIDHFLYSDLLLDGSEPEFAGLTVVSESPIIDEEGHPFRYELFSGNGYSDHLPLVLDLTFDE